MSAAEAMASIAQGISAVFGGPYFDATANWPGVPVKDDGGSIITPGEPIEKPCEAQVDSVTEAMRQDAGYRDRDVRLLVLAATLDGVLDTNATVIVSTGPNAGPWSVESVSRDPMGILWDCRGRRVDG